MNSHMLHEIMKSNARSVCVNENGSATGPTITVFPVPRCVANTAQRWLPLKPRLTVKWQKPPWMTVLRVTSPKQSTQCTAKSECRQRMRCFDATASVSVCFARRNNVAYSKWQDKDVQDRSTASAILKANAAIFAPILKNVTNLSYESSTVPASIKDAAITPLLKRSVLSARYSEYQGLSRYVLVSHARLNAIFS